MKLTIGMAVADDYNGVYFTVQALRMYHGHNDLELIVVDNMPDSKGSPMLQNLMNDWVRGRYIPMNEMHGTTQPRNRIFDEATGQAVMCIDSHVLLAPGSVERLIKFYEANPDTPHLYGGPMLYDDLVSVNTHFDNVWRAEMWGIWGTAWGCPCGDNRFTVLQDAKGNTDFRLLDFDLVPAAGQGIESWCSKCGRHLPYGPFSGHQQRMIEAGFISLGSGEGEPFPIPGQGLGLFTCLKKSWLGFNRHFRGFGGEEMYIHEKYRKAGHQAMCIPWLKWGHRFGRPHGIPYTKILTRWNKIRNYVLGAKEVGYSTDPIYEHFVKGGLMNQWEWDSLVSDPVGLEAGPVPPPGIRVISSPKNPAGCGGSKPQPRATINTAGELRARMKENPRDLDQHADKIAEYAQRCDIAVEFSKRRESIIPLLSAKKVYSWNSEIDGLLSRMVDIFPDKVNVTGTSGIDFPLPSIPECDLLFLSSVHDAKRLMEVFEKYQFSIKKYIVIHNTAYYGELNNDGPVKMPGLLPALRAITRAHPEWSVVYHSTEQFGLTVLSRLSEDKPKLPSTFTMAANLAKAITEHVADGLHKTPKDQYERRLEICSLCPQRVEDRCSVCGCFLANKAAMRIAECPLGLWPAPDAAAQTV